MATSVQSRWMVRLTTLVLWVLAAGSCVYWGLRVVPRAAPLAVAAPVRGQAPADPAAVARLLGASPAVAALPAVNVASRFNLVGVVASRSHRGAALIAVDGKPARPFRVGSAVDEGLVLQSVEGRRAVLAAGPGDPAAITLELPPLKR